MCIRDSSHNAGKLSQRVLQLCLPSQTWLIIDCFCVMSMASVTWISHHGKHAWYVFLSNLVVFSCPHMFTIRVQSSTTMQVCVLMYCVKCYLALKFLVLVDLWPQGSLSVWKFCSKVTHYPNFRQWLLSASEVWLADVHVHVQLYFKEDRDYQLTHMYLMRSNAKMIHVHVVTTFGIISTSSI